MTYFDDLRKATSRWDPAKHPRDPRNGRFIRIGARLRWLDAGEGELWGVVTGFTDDGFIGARTDAGVPHIIDPVGQEFEILADPPERPKGKRGGGWDKADEEIRRGAYPSDDAINGFLTAYEARPTKEKNAHEQGYKLRVEQELARRKGEHEPELGETASVNGPKWPHPDDEEMNIAREMGADEGNRRVLRAKNRKEAEKLIALWEHDAQVYRDWVEQGKAGGRTAQFRYAELAAKNEARVKAGREALEQRGSAPRRRHGGLPAPKGGFDYDAGLRAAANVKTARRNWMRRNAEQMLATLPGDHPERDYWRGVVAGAEGERAIPQIDRGRVTFVAGQRVGQIAPDPDAMRATAQEELEKFEAMVQANPGDKEADRARQYWHGVIEALDQRRDEGDMLERNRAAAKIAAQAVVGPLEEGDGDWDRRQQLVNRGRRRLLHYRAKPGDAHARERVAYYEAFLLQLGAAEEDFAGDDKYERGAAIAEAVKRHGDGGWDLPGLRAYLAKAQAEGNRDLVAYWAGMIEALLRPKEEQEANIEPPKGSSRARAKSHRVAGDDALEGPVSNIVHLGGGVNTSFRAKIGTKDVIVKPIKGAYRRRLRENIPKASDLERERASWIVADRLGVRAPRAIVRDVEGEGLSVVMEMIQNSPKNAADYPNLGTLFQRDPGRTDLRKMALLDAVIGNSDRHGNNFMVDANGHVWAIDHGLTFPENNTYFYNTVVQNRIKEEDRKLHDDEVEKLKEFDTPEWEQELVTIGLSPEAAKMARQRVKLILRKSRIPTSREIIEAHGGFAF